MANLKEVRDRISSVMSTQQITKAMKMVAAAKLRKAQQAILDMRPYSQRLSNMLGNIMSNLDGDYESSFGVARDANNVLVVVVTSNRGLCGAFNSSVSKMADQLVKNEYADQAKNGNVTLLFVGKKGYDFFKRKENLQFITDHIDLVHKDFSFEDSSNLSQMIIDQFAEGVYDRVDLVYAQFKNPAVQNFIVEPFLPVQTNTDESEDDMLTDFLFEPNQKELLDYLIPTILKTQFHKVILESNASEQGSRMTAMDKASENADEMLKMLKINYNKARQEAITAEISEIVGGVAALEDA